MIVNVYRHPAVEADFLGPWHACRGDAEDAAACELQDEPKTRLVGRLVCKNPGRAPVNST